MAVSKRPDTLVSRRRFLMTAAASAAVSIAKPSISRAASRPRITHGVQSGDVSTDSGMVWARTDRPARMLVDIATSDSFRDARRAVFVDALPESDFTAKALIDELPSDQDIFYRIQFQDLSSPTILSEPAIGRFRTAPSVERSVSFTWSGDTAGQGWGIDESRGGMRGYAAMRKQQPDFFIHCGDSIYADGPIPSTRTLPDGSLWRNLVTEEKSKVAETLADYRGNYKYNLLDANMRAFNAEVPLIAQWDDHEVVNDWWAEGPRPDARYASNSTLALVARAGRAFHEFMPLRQSLTEPGRIYRKIGYGPLLDVFMLDMRSYRGGASDRLQTSYGPDSYLLGPEQMRWLKRELRRSRATWKVIAADLPLGLISSDTAAQGDGPALGRELEIAELLTFMRQSGIRNTVWITADMHYTAAHYYDPNAAVFQDFEPFWEFVSGPLHAGTWQPSKLDNTFGPRVVYEKGCTREQGDDLSPCFGLQFFGHVEIDGATEVMTVTLKDVDNRSLWSVAIDPKIGPPRVAHRS